MKSLELVTPWRDILRRVQLKTINTQREKKGKPYEKPNHSNDPATTKQTPQHLIHGTTIAYDVPLRYFSSATAIRNPIEDNNRANTADQGAKWAQFSSVSAWNLNGSAD